MNSPGKPVSSELKNRKEDGIFHRTKMQKERILSQLKEQGLRITKQRLLIIDIILENECSCCKEIYYKASLIDHSIGIATVYRLLNSLEEIGAINRKNMYKVSYAESNTVDLSSENTMKYVCTVVLDDDTKFNLSAQKWNSVIKAGLAACGYVKNQKVASVTVTS